MFSAMLRFVFCFLLVCFKRLGVRALDADEEGEEIRLLHHLQQLIIVGDVHRGFGRELERIVVRLLPGLQLGQESLERLLVADQVVVDEVDMAAVAELIEPLELRKHLRVRLGARHCARRAR